MSSHAIPVLVPPSEITEKSLEQLRAALAPHLDAPGPGIVLDLELVEFINSSGLGTLVQVGMRLDGHGRRLVLARPNKTVERMLRLVGLDAKMPMFRSVEEASLAIVVRPAPQGR